MKRAATRPVGHWGILNAGFCFISKPYANTHTAASHFGQTERPGGIPPVMWLEFGLIGAAAGFAAGYLGIGGGLVLVPALSWIFLRDSATSEHAVHMAVATSLATMLVTSLSSIIAHQRKRAIDWNVVKLLTPGLLAGAMLGAVLADRLDTGQLAAVFGVFALLVGLQLMLGRNPEAHKPLPGRAVQGLVAGGIGMISSMVGIGGGSMTGPWLMWHGIRAQAAVAIAAACGYPIALAGSVVLASIGPEIGGSSLGYVHLPAFAGIAVVSAVTAPLGAAAVHRTPPGMVRRVFGGMLLLVAWRMLG